jgi:hypothetical protein
MHIQQDPISLDISRLESIQRLEKTFEQLSARIVRLAKLLDIQLDTDNGVDQAIHRASQIIEGTHDHHTRLWQELRGLLVLRYQIEKSSVQELGLPVIQTVITELEQHLEASGYAPKVDGLDLVALLENAPNTNSQLP